MREEEEVRECGPEVRAIDIGLPCTLWVKNVLPKGRGYHMTEVGAREGREGESSRS